jgi:hypothetical protein
MSGRPSHKIHGIKRGRLGDWPPDADPPDVVASKVKYFGDPVHKTYRSFGRPAAWRLGRDKTQCDHFSDEYWHLLQDVLVQAIITGYVSGEFDGGFPKRAWAWINGVLHEARLTNQGSGEYHGFPLELEVHYPEPTHRLRNAPNVEIPINKRI